MSVLLVIISITISTFGIGDSSGEYSDLFTYDEYESMKNKRIRKEIRDISNDQWKRIANAMNLMKYISTEEGQLNFGDKYINYDALVCQHAKATFHPGGDMAHIGPHFNIWHRAFILKFEDSLIAIDNRINSLPYWDFRRDIIEQNNTADLRNSIIFSDNYFGDYSTINDEDNYAVTNGKFAYWPIHDNPSEVGCDEFYQNAFGLLRQRDNIEGNPFVTRYGGTVCGSDQFSVGDIDVYDYCLNNITDYTEFFYCYNFNVHARAHIGVGGSRLAYPNQLNVQFPDCQCWHGCSWTNQVNHIRKWAQLYGCFVCPEPNTCSYDDSDANPFHSFQCAHCDLSNLTDSNKVCDIEGFPFTIRGQRDFQQIIGDFVDQSTSPNDPIFMFHHSNMDRYLMEWQIKNYDQKPYYNYPINGFQYGVHLNDIISYQAPFTNLFDDTDIGEGPYTIKDIWDGTSFINAPYAYDTILDSIKQNRPSSSSSSSSSSDYY